MIIIYEIIYFLLYHSLLASIVDTLETPDDLFTDSANKISPEQLLQSSNVNNASVKSWFDQVKVQASNTTAVVRKVSASGIKYHIGLYFIIEEPLISSRGINFLHPHVRILNRFLSKVQSLSYIAGIAHVPPLPSDWTSVSESDFIAGTNPKLEDILKSRIFGAIIAVFVFVKKPGAWVSSRSEICNGLNSVYWEYDLNPNENQIDLNDVLFQYIVILLGGCNELCDNGDYFCTHDQFYEVPAKNLSNVVIQCLVSSIQKSQVDCTTKPPEDVYVSVCGNGIVENTESCDCLQPLECGSKCDADCILRNKPKGRTNRTFIIAVSAAIIFLIIMASSLFLFLYCKQRNGVESQTSYISIPRGGSKTEFNVPVQCKLQDWTLTCTVADGTTRNAKSKLNLSIPQISSEDRSRWKTHAMSNERLTLKMILPKDRSQSKTNAISKERLKPQKISSKDRSISKTTAMSKERLVPKKISSPKITQNNSLVDLTKSIEMRKATNSTVKSLSKTRVSSNPKTVSSKSLPESKILKNDLKHNSSK